MTSLSAVLLNFNIKSTNCKQFANFSLILNQNFLKNKTNKKHYSKRKPVEETD